MPVALAGLVVWGLWLYRVILSRRARPTVNDFSTTTSVVVPSFHEDPDILMQCLETWLVQDPTEIIIVLDVDDIEAYAAAHRPRTNRPSGRSCSSTRASARRWARASGTPQARSSCSPTPTRPGNPGCSPPVQMPFVDPRVGAVGTQQNVYQRTSSVWRRIADWLVDLRYYDYVPAMGGPARWPACPAGPPPTAAPPSCRCCRTSRTSSSSAGAASPATTGG